MENSDSVWGNAKSKEIICPHCGEKVTAELIELKVANAIYKCPLYSCGREIHRSTVIGYIFTFGGLFS